MDVRTKGRLGGILQGLGLAVVYFLAAKWGLTLAFVQANATPVWPPTGIALAALLLGGKRLWPGIFLGAFTANLFTAGNVWTSLGIATGNSLEALVGCALIDRFAGGRKALERTSDLFKFSVLGGLVAPLVSATFGTATIALAGMIEGAPFKDVWFTWWLGDAGGALLVAPIPLLWPFPTDPERDPLRILEGGSLFSLTFLTVWLLFGGESVLSRGNYPVQFLFLPLMLWAAVRFGPFGAALTLLSISISAVQGTLHGLGPFHGQTENQSLLFLQGFMSMTSVTILALACGLEERRKAEEELRWSHSNLQLKVLERTEELTQANRELERQFREKEGLAHDLMESNEKFHLLSEAAQEGVVIVTEGIISGANSAFCRIFGYESQAVIGKRAEDFVTPDCRERVRGYILSKFEETYAVRGLRKDGEVIDLEITGKTIRQDGESTRVTAIRDVTERNRRDEELRRLALLVETSTDFICLAGLDGHMLYLNGEGRRLVGLTMDEDITPKLHQDFVAPQDVPRLMNEVVGDLVTKGRWAGEFRLRHFRTGDPIPFHFTAVLIRDPETGDPRAMAAIGRDITQRKKMEDLARSNQDLEQFAYVASHDLQEPLRMVTSFVQLLAHKYDGKIDEEGKQYMQEVVEGAGRMRALILDLLAYSRVESAGEAFGRVDCGQALRQALQNLNPSIRESGAQVMVGEMPWVQGDFNQIVQLFQNLVGNAIKFRSKGPLRISVDAEPREGNWVFRVRDNGIGIDPKYSSQIFEVFKRLHTRSEYPGTGIGLAICKKVVGRHGGRIWVESQAGQGASFCWTLPVLQEASLGNKTFS